MKLVWRLIGSELKAHKKAILLRILFAALIAATPYAFSFLGKWLVDEALQVSGPPAAANAVEEAAGMTIEWRANTTEEKLRLLGIFLAASLGLHLLTTALGAWSEHLNSRTVQQIVYDLRSRVNERLANADRELFGREQVGQLMTRVLDDCGNIPPNLTNLVINFVTQLMMLALGLFLLLRLNPSMTWVAVAALPFYAIACLIFLPRIRSNTEDLRTNASRMNGYIVERLSNIATVKNYAQEPQENQTFGGIVDHQSDMARRQHRLNLSFNTITTLITGLATLGVLIFGFLNIKAGTMQLGEVLAFHQVTAQLFVPISALVGMTTVAQTLQVLASRVFTILDAPVAIEQADETVEVEDLRGEITFEDVSMQYLAGGPFAVDKVNLTIPAGQTVCIVGRSGCGKSTLLQLLTRVYDPSEGTIRIDGVDIREWRLRRLRRVVGNVLYDCDVFSGTVAENIAYGAPKADRQRIEEIARKLHFHDYIQSLPKGYDTHLGRGGISLEPEELLKLNLARALLTNPTILTVDDTFATVEEQVEATLRAELELLLHERTILIATSRLSICQDADLIVVMQRGAIEQVGTHQELLAQPGLYRRLYTRQMGKH